MFLILVMKKSASVSVTKKLTIDCVSISGACVECCTSRITDHFWRGLKSLARNRSMWSWQRNFMIASLAVRKATQYFILSSSSWWVFHFCSSLLFTRLALTASFNNQWLTHLDGENLVWVCSGQWRARTAVVLESSCSVNCSAVSAGEVKSADYFMSIWNFSKSMFFKFQKNVRDFGTSGPHG